MGRTGSGSRGADRRRHPRVQMGISMDIHAKGHAVGKCRGAIEDLSTGGMAFKSTAVLEPGAALYLKINIPLEIRGEVRSIQPLAGGAMRRYGVRFHKIGSIGAETRRPEHFIAAKFNKTH